ncbi:tripartite tricarboxylate transporter TctB family protein [Brevibacillus sp. H7]|jgi:putative tricarboxylic transport membrane protein|uniref:tripartite tricarboxylate transporter TctB family protein n=1 Tax=Brevibacillus sp. H7 TaxID=3349138 RepID=UPI00382BF39A
MLSKLHPDQIGGLLSGLLGGIVWLEALRIKQDASSGIIGDHTLPALLGSVLILFGILLFFLPERCESAAPAMDLSGNMAGCVVTMFAYVFLIPIVGYVVSTFCAAIALFRLIGSYSWSRSISYSAVLTAVLYLVFLFGLQITFPRGVLV